MEDTLRVTGKQCYEHQKNSLNPCFNGRYSQSQLQVTSAKTQKLVLILVLMEDTLRESA